jgi:gliding motility-associated-like protein
VWVFGDGTGSGRNVAHIYRDPSDPKTYMVQLIAINHYCKDTLDIKPILVAYPKANYNFTTTCNSQVVQFENSSKGYTSATWYFGDGTSEVNNDKNLSHTYPANVTQVTATLVVYNSTSGCTDTMRKDIRFASIDSVLYTLSEHKGCAPLKVAMSAPKDTNIVNYIWEKGDGSLGFGSTFNTTYTKEGQYIIKLFVRYKNGCLIASSVRDTVTVIQSHADFNFDKSSGCVPAIFKFTDASTSSAGGVTSFTWTFDNNTTSSGNSASHTYNAIGTFPVRLTVGNAMGCRDSLVKSVHVSEVSADFDIDVNNVCGGKPIHFSNKSSSNAVTYLWDFGDGTTSTDSAPVHVYSQEKNYTVKLKVTDGKGCENTMTKPGFVHIKNIHVNFTASPTFKTCPDLISNFKLQADPNMQFQTIQWDFGNGNSSNDNNRTPQGVYTKADSFDVKLVVVDNNNCTDTVLKPNYIVVAGPEGSFSFNGDFGCAPYNVTFDAKFKNTTTTIWDFGNGDTKLDRTLATQTDYTYKREGEFTPTLVLKDDFGCTVNIVSKKKINVARLYTEFNVDQKNVCNGSGKVAIRDSIYSSPNSPVKEFYWTFADSTNKMIRGTGDTFIPTNPGSYYLRMYAENTFGCVAHDSVKVGVYTIPVIAAVEDKVICRGEQIQLKVSGNPDHVEWSPSASLDVSNAMSVLSKPDTTTTYVVKAYNYPQCPVFDTVKIAVRTKLAARAFPDTAVCVGDTVQLHATAENTSLNITKITWQAATTISSTTDVNPLAYPKTNTTYYAIIENGLCQLQKIPVTVTVKPLPDVIAGDDHTMIKGSEVQIDGSSTTATHYIWSPDYKLSCTDCQMPFASPEKDTTYTITAINELGCKASDNLHIRIIEDCSGNTIYVPNTFSPNGDGQNDVLRVLGPGVASVKQFRVFNRWGQIIFDTKDTNTGWDGTYNGVELNPGVYMYYMDVECINGQHSVKKGDITLLR